ncbi:MAG: molybdenum cofactor biosynthesis protein B [Desulfobacterales bacterium]
MGSHAHKKNAPRLVAIAIVTVSTTRTLETDESGKWIETQALNSGHSVSCRRIVPDDAVRIAEMVADVIQNHRPQVLVLTGGTGITPEDVTIEAVRPMLTKELTAFAPLFALLSHGEIGSAALLSRATAGVIGSTVVFCLPGSLNACRLAWNALIFPELGHLAHHSLKR